VGEPCLVKRGSEFGGVESIVLRVLKEAPHDRMHDERAEYLLGVEATAGAKDSTDLHERASPFGNVMDDAKVEDGIVGGVRDRDRSRIAHPEPNARSVGAEALAGAGNHAGVEIERVDGRGPERPEDQVGADSPAATDLECPPAVKRPAHVQQATGLEVPLDGSTQRVVHEGELGSIQDHGPCSDLPGPRPTAATAT
jgi:hypothetical protein